MSNHTTKAAGHSTTESKTNLTVILDEVHRLNVTVRTVECDGRHAAYDRYNRVAYLCDHLGPEERCGALSALVCRLEEDR